MMKPKKSGCRVCGDTERRLTRELCSKHYDRFLAKKKKLPDDEAEAFDAKCVEEGWIGPNRQGQRAKTDEDPFDQLIAEVREEFHVDLSKHVKPDETEAPSDSKPLRKAE